MPRKAGFGHATCQGIVGVCAGHQAHLERIDANTPLFAQALYQRIAHITPGFETIRAKMGHPVGQRAAIAFPRLLIEPAGVAKHLVFELLKITQFIHRAENTGEAIAALGVSLVLHDLHQRLHLLA